MSKISLKLSDKFGLLGLLGLLGVIGYMLNWDVFKPWLTAFAAFSLIGLRFFRDQSIDFPARLGLLSFWGFLGFLGFIPEVRFFKIFYILFGFSFFFVFLIRSKSSSQ